MKGQKKKIEATFIYIGYLFQHKYIDPKLENLYEKTKTKLKKKNFTYKICTMLQIL